MSTDANQQHTLYRFVSVRPPELFRKVKQNIRFVFGAEKGFFYDEVINRPEGQTKWATLKSAADSFTPYASDDELYKKFGAKAEKAEWLARNRSILTALDIKHGIEGLKPFIPEDLEKLWDNFYYQVVTEGDFYLKELLGQLLVLENLIVQPKDTDQDVVALANAKLVLPVSMFEETNGENNTASAALAKSALKEPTKDEVIFSTKRLEKENKNAIAEYSITRNRVAIQEVRKLEKQELDSIQGEYEKAMDKYHLLVDEAYKNATVEEKERILCPSKCPETYFEYKDLELPEIPVIRTLEVDQSLLKQEVSVESFHVIESLGLLKSRTYDEIVDGIQASIAEYFTQIYSNLPEPNKTVTIGTMAFAAKSAARSAAATTNSSGNTFVSDTQVPFIVSWLQTSNIPLKGKITFSFDMGYTGSDVVSAVYKAFLSNGEQNSNGTFSDTTTGNILTVTIFTNGDGLELPVGSTQLTMEAEFRLSNGTKINLNSVIYLKTSSNGIATVTGKVTQPVDSSTFIKEKFGVRRLGIADYKKVVAEVCCYREAEVSHIENIMAREFKSKTTTRERVEETSTSTTNEYEQENLSDTSTTERFEMQSEVSKILNEQKQFDAYGKVSGQYATISFEAGASYATATAKEESNRQAVTQGKEITQRASERIVSRFRQEVVKKITESYKEENSHVFDNRQGEVHVSGVYRYINAIYKNQIFNYGKRLIYEFMIPEPSRLYRYGIEVTASQNSGSNATSSTSEIVEPIDPITLGLSNLNNLPDNYLALANRYGAEVEAPPTEYIYIGKSYNGQGQNGSTSAQFNDLKIPSGYKIESLNYALNARRNNNSNINGTLTIGNVVIEYTKTNYDTGLGNPLKKIGAITAGTLPNNIDRYNADGTLPVSLIAWDHGSFTINISVKLKRTEESLDTWKNKAYNTIMAAYKDRLAEYNSKVTTSQEEGATYLESNPLFYRQIEQAILRKLCISYIMEESMMGSSYSTGTDFSTFAITQNQDMQNYANHVKFMEQAFEWSIMSYNFYPYFWGNRDNWVQLFQSDNDDATFRSFMQAGMARVMVTVRPGFENAVMHYMKFNQIWEGGQVPVIGDKLYLSIADELAEQEYTIEDSWETVLPTSLIALQRSGVALDIDGLPCGGGCEVEGGSHLKPSSGILGLAENTNG